MDPITDRSMGIPSRKNENSHINTVNEKIYGVFSKVPHPSQKPSDFPSHFKENVRSSEDILESLFSMHGMAGLRESSLINALINANKVGTLEENLAKQIYITISIVAVQYAPIDSFMVTETFTTTIENHPEFQSQEGIFDPGKIQSPKMEALRKDFESKKEIVVKLPQGEKTIRLPEKIPQTLALKQLQQELEIVLLILKANAPLIENQKKTKYNPNFPTPHLKTKTSSSKENSPSLPTSSKKEKGGGRRKSSNRQDKFSGSIEQDNITEQKSDEKKTDQKTYDKRIDEQHKKQNKIIEKDNKKISEYH